MSVYQNDKPNLLKKAFNSIAEQTYPREKIRIYLGIDGEIPQELEEIITDCKLVYKIERNEKNIGLSCTLNKLVNVLENEDFVFRMDADDISLPKRFEAQVKYMLENPDVDILGTAILEVNENDEKIDIKRYPRQNIKKYIAKGSPLAHPTVCFRKNAFEKINYSLKMRLSQDIDLWFQALKKDLRIDSLPEILYCLLINSAFFKRRGYAKSFREFGIYMKGIWSLHKLTHLYVYPISRLTLRLLPKTLVKFAYNSRLRKKLLDKQE